MKNVCSYTRDEYIAVLILDSVLEGLHFVKFPSCINSMLDDVQGVIDNILQECEDFYGK